MGKIHLTQKTASNLRSRRQTGRGRGTGKGKGKGKHTKVANQDQDSSSCASNSKSRRNRNRRRNQRNDLSQKGYSTREQCSSYHEEALSHQSYPDVPVNPIPAENPFPSLGNTVHEFKTASVWTSTSSTHQIFQSFDECPNGNGKEVDEFSRLGLQRLSFSKKHEPRSTLIQTKRNPLHSELLESIPNEDLEEATVDEGDEQKPPANQLPYQKPKWNMNRLRDRWWTTLALQRLHQELMDEIKLLFADRCKEAEDDSETSETDSGSYLEPIELISTNQPLSSEINVHSTIMDEMSEQGFGGSSSSRTEMVLNAIKMNDESALDEILFWREPNDNSAKEIENSVRSAQEALFACVEQDKPHLLRITLRHVRTSAYSRRIKKLETPESQVSPLMIAADLGQNQCLAILLSDEERHTSSLSSRDLYGNNVFHYCCRGRTDEGSLRILLKELSNGSKWKQQVLSKLLLLRNKEGKTSLHVACEKGREDIVRTFLSLCSSSLLSKMLSTTDASNQTPLLAAVASNSIDVVTCLIMWRGNNNRNVWKKASQIHYSDSQPSSGLVEQSQESTSPPCALVWAAKNGVIDIIHVLLQLCSVSGSDYRVTEALAAVIQSKASDEDKSESARILILAGGNAFADSVPVSADSRSSTTSPISVASTHGAIGILQTLIQVGREELKAMQQLRRRDPILQQQPGSFFQAMDTAENSQMKSALRNALIESLFYGWHHQEASLKLKHLSSAVALYKLGAELGHKDVDRLSKSMQFDSMQMDSRSSGVDQSRCFATSYLHHNFEVKSKLTWESEIDRTLLSGHSRLLRDFGWMKDHLDCCVCECPWMARRNNGDMKAAQSRHGDKKVCLVVRGSEKFEVHSSIVSLKSEKLASAIRFATMNDDADSNERIPEVFVDIDGRMLRYILQHIYHGSVSIGWPSNEDDIFRDLLDLMVVAEEALCPSLVQECEMRLLSSNPTRCFCWSCSKAVRISLDNSQHAVECMYFTEGFGTLITGNRALDVLAVTEFLSGLELEYSIRMAPIQYSNTKYISASEAWEKFDNTWKTTTAIQLLKDQAMMIILMQFRTAIESVSFQESVQYNSNPTSSSNVLSHQTLLLQTCLDELHQSSMLGD
ncbi:MAG: hypothetical protein SGBAC_002229 [Bacillariaceae sp.]